MIHATAQPLRLSSGRRNDRWIHHWLSSSRSVDLCALGVGPEGGGIFGSGTFHFVPSAPAVDSNRACFSSLGAATGASFTLLILGLVRHVGEHGTNSEPLGFACDFGTAQGTTRPPFWP